MNLRYPIGHFIKEPNYTNKEVFEAIRFIEQFPSLLKIEVLFLSPCDLKKSYRDEGWSISQLIHHLADSHMNAFIRTKWALTENLPTIKPYLEASWAIQADYNQCLIDSSIQLIDSIHNRWTVLLKSLSPEQWERGYYHPDLNEQFSLRQFVMLYKWHGLHHLEHIKIAKN